MTRATLQRKLRWITLSLVAVLVVGLVSRFIADDLLLKGLGYDKIAESFYETLKDMAVVIVTIAAVYVAHILQRRANFIESLEEEWRNIVKVKSKLYSFCELDHQSDKYKEKYIEAFCAISEAIDSMRIVYRNVGETSGLIGLYPYVPLHDMRRALLTLKPNRLDDSRPLFTPEERKLVREAILQSFYALRETFLEELDLEEPKRPLLITAMRRAKRGGAHESAKLRQRRQELWRDALASPQPDVDELLKEMWNEEHKPRRG